MNTTDKSVVDQAFQLWKLIVMLDEGEDDAIVDLQSSPAAMIAREMTREIASLHPEFADFEMDRHLA